MLGLLALGALAACTDQGVRPSTTLAAADSADQVLYELVHYVTEDGVRRSLVEADTAYFYEATQTAELRGVKVTFYQPSGAVSSTLTSREGTYRWQTGAMEARGEVVAVTPDGKTLRTSILRYDRGTDLLSTDQPFTFDDGTDHLEGNSFTSDPDFENVRVAEPRGVAGEGVLVPGQQ
ncbi:MAG TPA: LPS export ABC transporter periplasmic protein LptC [Gemmatimonadales bacterium]|nr:LPS export ABC transporter periplasmic protein LptC [Gemmatimonadales bacterium]